MNNYIEKIFLELVGIKSDTGTSLERNIEEYLYNWFENNDYFIKNKENFGLYKLNNDHLKRSIVWGLVKGSGNDTVVLIHHHDVVNELDYGKLSKYAYSPFELMKTIKEYKLPNEIEKELGSGEWIFGRGTADMKAGASIQLYLIDKYSKLNAFKGNLLIISVPDEECLSAGMREAIYLLNELNEKFNLNYKLLINSEPHQREKENEGVIYEGSVGKIMPIVYVRGKQTHVGDIFEGFNPVSLLSSIVRRTELNTGFSDVMDEEITPPPSWTYFRDNKKFYDVSIPRSACGYFSILNLYTSPYEIINKIKKICEESFEEVLDNMNENYNKYLNRINKKSKKLPWRVNVKTFDELYNQAKSEYKDAFINDYKKTMDNIKINIKDKKINMQEASFILIEKTLEYIKDISPIVIIGLSPPYYPNVCNRDFNDLSNTIKYLSDRINEYSAKNWNENYKKKNYFMGISDMSYTFLNNHEEVKKAIGPNMPLWDEVYSIYFEGIKKLSIPVVNIGPWGKDIHKFTERVYKKDLLERTPKLIDYAIQIVLDMI
ncbi:M20/M25/M40 family metallo-hydrolase [Tepidibacter formicigenes]|jgi:arginine utilization protein RocB|uniref:Arginine utilization protein RocB n=1 Tax=Tepidibacter formicigenes DSM 15518 TaxID=1123349 RepID=A0A1M6JLF6_9FIRM|nr:M20/M25/M40 family metallo-hydrolase [Tepidibacter formicigenes]SHJ47506.1 Arginine utilization protein RocB [Tepidibacter formicigenes DSM 15518]